jgi:hypothetical protein
MPKQWHPWFRESKNAWYCTLAGRKALGFLTKSGHRGSGYSACSYTVLTRQSWLRAACSAMLIHLWTYDASLLCCSSSGQSSKRTAIRREMPDSCMVMP